MANYEFPIIEILARIFLFLAPATALVVIVACLSAGAVMAFRSDKHWGGL